MFFFLEKRPVRFAFVLVISFLCGKKSFFFKFGRSLLAFVMLKTYITKEAEKMINKIDWYQKIYHISILQKIQEKLYTVKYY